MYTVILEILPYLFSTMDILIVTSFLAGVLTFLAPCVLPILPVILAGSLVEQKKWYPYAVIGSLIISIVLFTVLLKVSTSFIDIPQYFWNYLSGGILVFFGSISLFPHLWTTLAERLRFNRSNQSLDHVQDISSPFVRAIGTGAALGPVFSTCSPTYTLLLATVFPVSIWA
jgi:cytochrome c biogenesis protein CcdA